MSEDMEKKFPFYPSLSEEGKQQAQALIDGFKKQLAKAADDVLSEVYCDIVDHIESDSWTNFRNKIVDAFRDYGNRGKCATAHDFARIRRKLLDEYRDEIIADIQQDIVEENERLKAELEIAWNSRTRG